MGIKGKRRREKQKLIKENASVAENGNEEYRYEVSTSENGMGSLLNVDSMNKNENPYEDLKNTDFYDLRDYEYLENSKLKKSDKKNLSSSREAFLGGDIPPTRSQTSNRENENLLQAFLSSAPSDSIVKELLSPGVPSSLPESPLRERSSIPSGIPFSHSLFGIDPSIVDSLRNEGFSLATTIQERVIPYALSGYDILGQAKTGSGKTLAFSIPLLQLIAKDILRSPKNLYAVVISPTKELCLQIHSVIKRLIDQLKSSGCHYTSILITGGKNVLEERKYLLSGSNIVVATPGRLRDHMNSCKIWNLKKVKVCVLDEADRLLSSGFQKDLDVILKKIPSSRQTLLFSATNSKSIDELARFSFTKVPLFIDIISKSPIALSHVISEQSQNGTSLFSETTLDSSNQVFPLFPNYNKYSESDVPNVISSDTRITESSLDSLKSTDEKELIPSKISQFAYFSPLSDRLRSLYVLIKILVRKGSKAMVFCSTIASVIFQCQMMGAAGFHNDVLMLHGQMKHRQRLQTFQCFLEWKTGILFCTDVAARGLDIPNIDWVIQYDAPLDPTEYIHRIGRTARAGMSGKALLFLSPNEVGFISYLSSFDIHLSPFILPSKLPNIQAKFEHILQLDPIVARSAVSAFRAYVGAYQSHILKEIFQLSSSNLSEVATSFALTHVPPITLLNEKEEKEKHYVKGFLRSFKKRKREAENAFQRLKTKPQWSDSGDFIGIRKS